MQEFSGELYKFSGKHHDAEARDILDLIRSCVSEFDAVIWALTTQDYPKPEISRLIKVTDSLHIPTGPEPRVTKTMVTETLNKFKQWIGVLGDMSSDWWDDVCFIQQCGSNIEDYRIDTEYLIRKLRRLIRELRIVVEYARSERQNRVQMTNPLLLTSRHKGKQAYIHEAFLNVQDVMYDLRRWGSRLEDGKQRRMENIHRKNWEVPVESSKAPAPRERKNK